MSIQLDVITKNQGTRTGTKENPFVSGGIYFIATVSGTTGGTKLVWNHKWVVGGIPIPANETTPEMWYGRDGMGLTPSFHPTRKTTLSCVEVTVFAQGYESEPVKLQRWVMAAEDEPEPLFAIQCNDGIGQVTKDQLEWLKDGRLEPATVPPQPRPVFSGTRQDLKELIASIEAEPDPEPEPEPPEPSGHPVICSDGTVYLSTYNFTFLLNKGKIGNAGGKTYFNGSKAELEAIVKVIPPEPKPEPPDSDEPIEPQMYHYFLPLRVVDEVDSGIYLSAAEKAEVKLSIFRQSVPSSEEGKLQDVKTFTLGKYNVLARMVRGDWHIQEADSALVVSDVPLACCSVWVTKDNNVQYTGFPGLEA